jgi:eukaryotic-like serine/threonine-protein kinase
MNVEDPKDPGAQEPLTNSPGTDQTIAATPAVGSSLNSGAATRMAVSPSGAAAPAATPPPDSSITGEFAALVGPSLRPGSILASRYEILQMLGQGGMGAVYKARDRQVDRLVAVKIIRPEMAANPAILQRFIQELVLARQITHRNVIRIYDIGEAEGIKFITMEYVEGKDLRSIMIEKGKLPAAEAVSIIEQTAAGLSAAHAEGVIHRDLKPGNIMQDATGRIVVMDFGLARTLGGDGMTQTGMMLGTMEYMSPEQAKAEELDARSDLYTLGLIFFELLSGQVPFRADSALASLVMRTQQRATPLVTVDPNVPAALSNIVARCLERDPSQRYRSTDELIEDLRAWRGGAAPRTVFVHPTFPEVAKTPTGKYISIAVVAIALLIGGSVFVKMKFFPSESTRSAANHAPVSVLVGDFTNHTGDPIFEGTLEPMFNVALEGASFVSAYNRSNARRLAQKLPHPSDKLDEQSARLVAVGQGISTVVTGELSRRGDKYSITATALDAVTGNVLAQAEGTAANKDEVLLAIPKIAAPLRKALGDTTPESVQVEKAAGAFTAASLEVVHQYSQGMDQLFSGRLDEALKSYNQAATLDPNFARAYAGIAAVSGNLGKPQEAEKNVKLAMEHVDRLTDRERYRVRGFYYYTTGNWQKCVEEYGELVKVYPADNVGQANLAGCYIHLRDTGKAIAAAQRAVEIVPQGALQRVVLSFYNSYAGNFAVAESESRKALGINPSFVAYLALAESQLGQGQMSQARETYREVEKLNPQGASLAASGLADLASYDGRYTEAVRLLETGAAADIAAKNPEGAGAKYAAIAQVQLARRQNALALAAATKALTLSQDSVVRFLAAQTYIEAGEPAKAQKLATGLGSEPQSEAQVYGKILEGNLALKRGDKSEAIKSLTDANNLLDTWMGRFELGRAYLEAGLFVEADSEFDRCIKRRGEALELFMDNNPTVGYLPMVYYYQGRVRDGLKSSGAAESYRQYLNIRQAGEDPLVPEIRRRLGQ